MTSISAGHIILTPTQPVGSGTNSEQYVVRKALHLCTSPKHVVCKLNNTVYEKKKTMSVACAVCYECLRAVDLSVAPSVHNARVNGDKEVFYRSELAGVF